jgi:bifunctional DNase/RNase
MNTNVEHFKLYDCQLNSIVIDPDGVYVCSIICEEEEYGLPLIGCDGTIVTFTESGFHNDAHINTIHQTYLRFKEYCGFTLVKCIIEAKHGDVFYCRLHWNHTIKDKDIYNVVSLGDVIILHLLAECPLLITQYVVKQLELFDSEGYTQNIED